MRLRFLGAVGLATAGAVLLAVLPFAAAPAAAQGDDYGVIAYSPSTGFDIAGFGANITAAALAAVQSCAAGGATDCTPLDWFYDAMAAFAEGTNGAYGTGEGWSNDLTVATDYADKYAIQTCQQFGGTDCRVTSISQTATVSSSGNGGIYYFTRKDPRLQGALKWMLDHQGSSKWSELCETAVEAAYGTSGRYATAAANYKAQHAAGRIHDPYNGKNANGPTTAPAGALVFFTGSDPSTGHVGIAVGDGSDYWTTDGTIHIAPLSEGDGYLGWSFAPTSWPGS
jgi:Domain of unknown function (DUF4189)